ncbi:predicted protein [Histoplasma capsulatum G186AR]|uniref:Uncharacterized protein n=1 Tax=Ajellomyces capsulatus (strain G186AR / H82 / ATCC MYA-2454 / RMSCC 2432) TaxID=447093 RepID=C0P0W7_AJECG|nr:uncharacterized protein HCBG_09047 [Histoplasma capsulatum G186AR]EEH02767.1 predicted protein [Histoplasma capsulatum G186AR]
MSHRVFVIGGPGHEIEAPCGKGHGVEEFPPRAPASSSMTASPSPVFFCQVQLLGRGTHCAPQADAQGVAHSYMDHTGMVHASSITALAYKNIPYLRKRGRSQSPKASHIDCRSGEVAAHPPLSLLALEDGTR